MQMYAVRTCKKGVNKKGIVDGCIANKANEVMIYTRGEAIKKAKLFVGKIEKYGKNYTVTDSKSIQLSSKELSGLVVSAMMNMPEIKAFVDVDSYVNETIYYGSVFQEILNVQNENTSLEIIQELRTLAAMCSNFSYIHLVD